MTDLGILTALRSPLGEDSVLDRHALGTRTRNHWDTGPLEARAMVMRLCHARRQTIVVHGGLTGVCDGDRATSEDIIVSLEHMAAIEQIDPIGRTATVQAGNPLSDVHLLAEGGKHLSMIMVDGRLAKRDL